VRLDASRGMPTSLVPKIVRFDPKPITFGSRLDGCPHGAPYRVFKFTLQRVNISIVGLSPLSETA
jgi:hypothetical protein